MYVYMYLYESRMLENYQLLCQDDNFVSQRGLFRQFEV